MKAIQALLELKDTLRTPTDCVVSKKHPAEEKRPMRAVRMVTVSQTAMRYAIAGILSLINDVLIASATLEGQNGVCRTHNLLQTMLLNLFNEANDEKLISVKFESCFLRKIEEVSLSLRHKTNMTEDMM